MLEYYLNVWNEEFLVIISLGKLLNGILLEFIIFFIIYM